MKILSFLIGAILFSVSLNSQTFNEKLSAAALELTKMDVEYDPSYFSIDYPSGDIPEGKGVCTDVVIRAYRTLGIDLQKEVHEEFHLVLILFMRLLIQVIVVLVLCVVQ